MFATRSLRGSLLLLALAVLTHAACVAAPGKAKQHQHVLNRIGYGPDSWSLARVAQLGSIEAYIEEQLHPELLDDTALEDQIATLYPVTTMTYGHMRIVFNEYTGNGDTGPFVPKRDATQAKALRALKSKRQLEQVLVDFWFNHFNVDGNVEEARWGFVTLERDAIRPNVLGNFETMLLASARNPGMLDYLDNALNFKEDFIYLNLRRGINENYGRELLELHTLGVDGGYTQEDVREAARALTGWTLPSFNTLQSDGFFFLPQGHDQGAKQILDLAIPGGGGESDGVALIQYLAHHPKTAERVSRKLVQRFVSETPPAALVQAAAQVFLNTGGDLRQVMRTILLSPEFLGLTYARTKVKRPFVFVASLARTVGVSDDVAFANGVDGKLQQMGEGLYRAGPPTGYPESSRFWSGEGPYVQRVNLAWDATHANMGFNPLIAVTSTVPTEIVERLRLRYLQGSLESTTRDALVALMTSLPAGARVPEAAATMLASPDFMVH